MEPNDWMSHRAREEIEYSLKVHKSVKEELKSSPIILSTPNREQLHPLHLPNKGSTRTRLSPEEWRNDNLRDRRTWRRAGAVCRYGRRGRHPNSYRPELQKC